MELPPAVEVAPQPSVVDFAFPQAVRLLPTHFWFLLRMATVDRSSLSRANFAASDSTHQPSAVGRMGPWQLVKLISESELARVYSARPAEATDPSAPYVVKALRKEWWRDPQAIEMQRRAAWIGQQISHPHLLPVFCAGVQQAPFYYVTPKLSGMSLGAILRKGKRFSLPISLWIARQIAEALAALHEEVKMIHADVKPDNVVVSGDGHATLIDLGFAHAPSEARHWSMRPIVGTLNYISPETVTSALTSGPGSDLYSLGVTLYELLSGRVPFVANSPDELVRLHREEKPPCLRQLVPGTPSSVASLVHRMLAKDPFRRPSSASSVVDELMRLEVECFSCR